MARNLPITGPFASLNFNDPTLDDVVHVSVADGTVLTLRVIYRAEDGLIFFRL